MNTELNKSDMIIKNPKSLVERQINLANYCLEHIASNKQNSIANETCKSIIGVRMTYSLMYAKLLSGLNALKGNYSDVDVVLKELNKMK